MGSHVEKDGRWRPGRIGTATHLGPALSDQEISALAEGTRIVVTWSGGNGPWEGTLVQDPYFGPSYQSDHGGGSHELLNSLHRVTLVPSSQKGGEADG